MKLTIGERIMIHRKRRGLRQAELGEKAFAGLKASNAKIKKIELGQQRPTDDDIVQIERVLGVSLSEEIKPEQKGFLINKGLFDTLPQLKKYLSIFNEAVDIGDTEFIYATCRSMVSNSDLCKKNKGIKKTCVNLGS